MDNPYKEELDIFFTRIVELQNILFHLTNILKKDIESKIESVPKGQDKEGFALGSHLIISDISGKNGKGDNSFFPTGYTKQVDWDKYEKEIKKVISREASFLISQAYESFNRFLKNCSAIFLFMNKKMAAGIDNKFADCETIEEFKRAIRKSRNTCYPSQLFKILDANCIQYKLLNKNNILNAKLSDYHSSLAFFRNKVTHSSSTFTKKELNDKILSRGLKEIFEHHFPYQEIEKKEFKFKMDNHKGRFVISRTAEVGFQIYKGLSKCADLKWKLN